VRLLDIRRPWLDGEAHRAQLLCYLRRSVISERDFVEACRRVETSPRELAEAAAAAVTAGEDSDFLLPALLRFAPAMAWTRASGRSLTLRALTTAAMDADLGSRSCYGLHWGMMIADLADDGLVAALGNSYSQRIQALAKHLVASLTVDSAGQIAPTFHADWPPHPGFAERLVAQSHGVEFLMMLPHWFRRQIPGFWSLADRATAHLLELLRSRPHGLPIAPRAHAARAMRLYASARLSGPG
jgi:hypothetical protein